MNPWSNDDKAASKSTKTNTGRRPRAQDPIDASRPALSKSTKPRNICRPTANPPWVCLGKSRNRHVGDRCHELRARFLRRQRAGGLPLVVPLNRIDLLAATAGSNASKELPERSKTSRRRNRPRDDPTPMSNAIRRIRAHCLARLAGLCGTAPSPENRPTGQPLPHRGQHKVAHKGSAVANRSGRERSLGPKSACQASHMSAGPRAAGEASTEELDRIAISMRRRCYKRAKRIRAPHSRPFDGALVPGSDPSPSYPLPFATSTACAKAHHEG